MTKKIKSSEKTELNKPSFSKDKVRKFMLGSKDDMGFLRKLFTYAILICVGFVFIYPLINMLSTSMMTLDDLIDTSIQWIPSTFNLQNYSDAAGAMDFWESLKDSFIIAGLPTIIQVCICAFVGYGFARFDFRGKNLMMGLLVFSFIIPPQILMMPTYVLYLDMHLIGHLRAYIIPAILGQGFKSQIFILICWQFFRQVPQSLIEAAQIDGAGYFKSFFRIAIPSAAGALLVVFLFSFVWYWNESYLANLYINGGTGKFSDYKLLVVQLAQFNDIYTQYAQSGAQMGAPQNNESVRMAGTMLTVIPLLLIYFVLQRQFVESVDRTGITGE